MGHWAQSCREKQAANEGPAIKGEIAWKLGARLQPSLKSSFFTFWISFIIESFLMIYDIDFFQISWPTLWQEINEEGDFRCQVLMSKSVQGRL